MLKEEKKVPGYFKNFCKQASPSELRTKLEDCVINEKIHFLHYMLTSKDFTLPELFPHHNNDLTTYDKLARTAILTQQHKVLRYLLESEELKEHASPNEALKFALENKQMETALLLLTEMKKKADINYIYKNDRNENENFLIYAIDMKNYSLIEFLTSSPLLQEHIDINALDSGALYKAVTLKDKQSINYLLSIGSDNIFPKIEDKIVIMAIMTQNTELLKRFIKDYDLERNETIDNFLISSRKNCDELLEKKSLIGIDFDQFLKEVDTILKTKDQTPVIKKKKMS